MNPFEVPVMIWLPWTDQMAEVVACLMLGSVSVRGSDGMRCLVGMGELMSTRYGWSSNKETVKRKWLYGWSSAV